MTSKELSEKLYKKYKVYFKYSCSEVKKIYDGKKDSFKSMSMDFNDLNQELFPIVFEAVKKYDEKYILEKKVYLKKYIKNRVAWELSNMLRNKKPLTLNKFPITEEFYFIDSQEKDNYSISEKHIINLVYKYCKNDKEKEIMVLKILDNLTFEKIGKIKSVSKQRIGQIFNSVISKMKKEIKNIDIFYRII